MMPFLDRFIRQSDRVKTGELRRRKARTRRLKLNLEEMEGRLCPSAGTVATTLLKATVTATSGGSGSSLAGGIALSSAFGFGIGALAFIGFGLFKGGGGPPAPPAISLGPYADVKPSLDAATVSGIQKALASMGFGKDFAYKVEQLVQGTEQTVLGAGIQNQLDRASFSKYFSSMVQSRFNPWGYAKYLAGTIEARGTLLWDSNHPSASQITAALSARSNGVNPFGPNTGSTPMGPGGIPNPIQTTSQVPTFYGSGPSYTQQPVQGPTPGPSYTRPTPNPATYAASYTSPSVASPDSPPNMTIYGKVVSGSVQQFQLEGDIPVHVEQQGPPPPGSSLLLGGLKYLQGASIVGQLIGIGIEAEPVKPSVSAANLATQGASDLVLGALNSATSAVAFDTLLAGKVYQVASSMPTGKQVQGWWVFEFDSKTGLVASASFYADGPARSIVSLESLQNRVLLAQRRALPLPHADHAYIKLCKPATFFMMSV